MNQNRQVFEPQVIKSPDDNLLAFLLGAAIGVMSFLSVIEMLIHNAMHANAVIVVVSFVTGYIGFILFERSLPEMDAIENTIKTQKYEEEIG